MRTVLSKFYVCANLLGLGLYAVFVLRIAHEIHLEHVHGADGSDIVTFYATAFPILAVFVVANLIWALWASTRLLRRREWEPIFLMDAAVGSWVVIVLLLRQLS
jgi:hypothetical protein